MKRFKYPRTPHLPFTASKTADDRVLLSDAHFYAMDSVVVTTKMDGENTTVYADGYCHARSLDSKHQSYHSWLMQYIQQWCYLLPKDVRVCGEYLFAEHSIRYESLPSYFLGFSAWNKDICLSWVDTMDLFDSLGIYHVPVLYVGKYDTKLIQTIAENVVANGQEGLVVRNAGSYNIKAMADNIAKYVRPNHVQTGEHWTKNIVQNGKLVK